jgi:hypothetical protein
MPSLLFLVMTLTPAAGPAPQLARGQELVYRGTCVETVQSGGRVSRQEWSVDTRVFVLEATPARSEVAVFTAVRGPGAPADAPPAAVRVAVWTIGPHGESSPAAGAAGPVDTAVSVDPIALVGLPDNPLEPGLSWSAPEGGRPPRLWRVAGGGVPPGGGGNCWRLEGTQRSAGWEQSTGPAWRRTESVWLDPRTHRTRRIERSTELRDPEQAGLLHQLVSTWTLDTEVNYPDRLEAELRAEIRLAAQVEQELDGPPRALDGWSRRLTHHIRSQPATPYREAVVAAQRRLDAARRGQVKPVAAVEAAVDFVRGRPAPDFIAAGFDGSPALHLRRQRGRPGLIAFLRADAPASAEAADALAAAARPVNIVVVAGSDDDVRKFRAAAAPHLTLFDGRALAHLAPATPRFVWIDADGAVTDCIDGFGPELPGLLRRPAESADRK